MQRYPHQAAEQAYGAWMLNLSPNVLFHSNQLMTIKGFIRNNIASGFLFPQVLQKEDQITAIPVQEDLHLNVAVIWRKNDYLTVESEKFVRFCRRTFDLKNETNSRSLQ